MKRRKAIRQIGLGLTAGIVIPGWLGSCKEDHVVPVPSYDGTVAIIGAGAAGLYAADILKAQGIPVVLYEASNRLGGRVRTLKSIDKPSASLLFNSPSQLSSDFPNELGAGEVIGSDSVWGEIVESLKIVTVNTSASAPDHFFLDGVRVEAAVIESDPDFIAAKNFVDTIASYGGGNVSVQQAIENAGINPRMHAILNSWIGNKYGTANETLSMVALSEGSALLQRNDTVLTLADNPMQDALLSRFSKVVVDVALNSTVKEINYTGEKIVLAGTNSETGEPFSHEVDRVIVTVPVSILKNGSINFTPGLPAAKTGALGNMGMDSMVRVLLDFKANFWGESSGFLYGGTTAPDYFNSGGGRSTVERTLAVTVGGPKASSLSAQGKGMIPVLLAELDTIFAGKATANIRKDNNDNMIAIIQDWSLEPYIKGGVSFIKPGGTNQHRVALASPVDNKLFFAGEATDVNGESGTINGALLSAERSAQEVIESL